MVCEGGIILLNEAKDPLLAEKIDFRSRISSLKSIEEGYVIPELEKIVRRALAMGYDEFLVPPQLISTVSKMGVKAESMGDGLLQEIQEKKLGLLVSSGLVANEEEAKNLVRDVAILLSEAKIRELSARPDLQAIHAVQALDELDRAINLLSARIREWYGLHYPELWPIVDDPVLYAKLVGRLGRRENFDVETLCSLGISQKLAERLAKSAKESKGGEARDEDLRKISYLAEEVIHLSKLRESMAEHIEKTMAEIAPNITSVVGATIGARLLAKAGGLDKMARLPASTIQVLGAEKALFRSLRTGTKPPKHGILFQHPAVHSAQRWQRGKIARSLAAKLAIAARVDAFRGEKIEGLEEKIERRLEEVKTKYGKPPKKVKSGHGKRRRAAQD